jgi:hypothetical protein
MSGCIVASTVRKAPPAQAHWKLSNRPFPRGQAPAVQKVGTACARKTTSRVRETAKSAAAFCGLVVSPLLFSVTSQHNIPHTSLDGGGGYTDLLHLRPREARRRSTPSSAEGGAMEVYSISGRGRRDGGLLHLWPREARQRSSSTPGLYSKSAAAVSNATGTSPCHSAHCSAIGRFSRPSL